MILNAGCTIVEKVAEPSAVVLMLRPQSGLAQKITASEITINPPSNIVEYTDAFGNLCQRAILPGGEVHIECSCTAEVSDAIAVNPNAGFTLVQNLPHEVLQYLLPSRYCPSDLMLKLASEIAGKIVPGYQQVEAIRSWIQQNIRYQYGFSTPSTSALETAHSRTGVCRDFSHLGITLCRALRIPARSVVGYLYQLDPMDLHAWFEAFVGGRWYTFDATQAEPQGNRIVLSYGRDAADVAQVSVYGPVEAGTVTAWVNLA
ncbi:MAG TPA: transglutaminase family protein [Chthoniobacterales bacterium]